MKSLYLPADSASVLRVLATATAAGADLSKLIPEPRALRPENTERVAAAQAKRIRRANRGW